MLDLGAELRAKFPALAGDKSASAFDPPTGGTEWSDRAARAPLGTINFVGWASLSRLGFGSRQIGGAAERQDPKASLVNVLLRLSCIFISLQGLENTVVGRGDLHEPNEVDFFDVALVISLQGMETVFSWLSRFA